MVALGDRVPRCRDARAAITCHRSLLLARSPILRSNETVPGSAYIFGQSLDINMQPIFDADVRGLGAGCRHARARHLAGRGAPTRQTTPTTKLWLRPPLLAGQRQPHHQCAALAQPRLHLLPRGA